MAVRQDVRPGILAQGTGDVAFNHSVWYTRRRTVFVVTSCGIPRYSESELTMLVLRLGYYCYIATAVVSFYCLGIVGVGSWAGMGCSSTG